MLEKQVLTASKAVCKKLLQGLVKRKKVALLEELYPVLSEQKGVEIAVAILHGCRCVKKDSVKVAGLQSAGSPRACVSVGLGGDVTVKRT